AEQGTVNTANLDGYRSIADRGLLLNGAAGAINAAALSDAEGMPFSLVNEAGALDIVHLGNRNLVANSARVYGSSANNAAQPNWQTDPDQTGPQVTDLASSGYTLTASSRLGVIYQVSDFGGRFDTVVHFTDGSSATLTMRAPDWFGVQVVPAPVAGSGLDAQRALGVFLATDQADTAFAPATNLNVVEAVTSVQRLAADGFGDFTGKQIDRITFQNPVSNANYANSTPATGSGFAIIAATLRDITVAPPACPADIGVQGGVPGQDGVLDNNDFVIFIDYFFSQNPLADRGVQGGVPGSDGIWDNNDFIVFIDQFFAGCGS
ncbi:MAG: GC-type dockerin domain-anchored protein, partial [Phycisphaerales bacterium]|nr:GC-type dockerin domain-anchored protein [Phycisphaerales bacterium]